MINILLAEDDKSLNNIITSYLKSEGYNVDSFFNGLDALDAFYNKKYDLIISDIMMPLCDGLEMTKNIRENDKLIPIIFMSARDNKLTKKIGYKTGIDDYIVKPFDLDELVFKVQAILRRLSINNSNCIQIGNLVMDNEEHNAYVDGVELNLTVREFEILYKMLSYPKKTFSRSKLMEEFWDFDSSATSRTVDVHLSKLRDKTKNCDGFEIQTVHGLGYKVILK